MSEGPHDPHDGTPRGDRDGYDWLYGDRSGSDADVAAGSEHTRMMPTIPRPADAPSTRPVAPPFTPGERILPPLNRPPRRPSVRIKWRRILTLFVALPLTAWLAFLIMVPALSWGKIARVDAAPSDQRPAAGQGTNYLLVGSDSRRGLSAKQMQRLGVGGVAVGAGRTDTIMILHLGSGPATLLSIPRDSWVSIPGHGSGKINSAFFYGGAKLLVQTIESNTGLRIDHYVEIGLGGFVQAVDAVGGVRICPKSNVTDKNADLHIKKGCQNADGATALAWSRSRDAFALGDLARAQHQREIVHEVGQKAKSPATFILPWRYLGINNAAVAGLTVDNDMSIWSMISFARGMSSASKNCSMPLAGFGNPLYWSSSKVAELMRYFRNDDTANIPSNLCTPTGLAQ